MSQALANSIGRISRNRLLNPDSAIDQRNGGAAFALTATVNLTTDRIQAFYSQTGKLTSQQYAVVLGATQPTNSSHKISVVAQYTPIASDYGARRQLIEGFRMRDLLWGSSFARSMVYTVCGQWPVAGVYSVAFQNAAQNRSYVSTFTVANANTLETHSVVVPGDVTGTWPVDNTQHAAVVLNLGYGSTYTTSTLNAWQAGNYLKAAGAIDLVAQTNGSAMYIAWEQFERDFRTDFEVVQYDDMLRMCQRYCEYIGNITAYAASTTVARAGGTFKVTKRAAPALGAQVTGVAFVNNLGGNPLVTSYTNAAYTTPDSFYIDFAVASGLTSGQGCIVQMPASSLSYVAEL